LRLAWLLLALALAAGAARAAPRGIDDCEAIQNAMAYNACLASFGPKASRAGALLPGEAPRLGAGPPRPRLSGALARRLHGGRVHVEITPKRR
jgi:hypothetical protein